MVYVQDINGKPLMPTTRHGKVRRLLKDKKAVVVNLCPFTIKLMYVTSIIGLNMGLKNPIHPTRLSFLRILMRNESNVNI